MLRLPLSDADIFNLRVGDAVLLSGVMVTARDAAHAWLVKTFLSPCSQPSDEDQQTLNALKPYLQGGLIYHCGPVVRRQPDGSYDFVSAGPTTSMREEPYEADVMRFLGLKGVIGKGGMGRRTLQACQELPAVYLHAIGGAGAWIAQTVQQVLEVHLLKLGVPEAMWVIKVCNFPAVVTMDAYGDSLHARVEQESQKQLERLMKRVDYR